MKMKSVPMIVTVSGDRQFRFTISTGATDRDGDRIDPSGWKLDEYRKNPIVLWQHRRDLPPIARTTDIRVIGRTLQATCQFPPAGLYDLADEIHNLVGAGFLHASSVGFVPNTSTHAPARGGYDIHEATLLEWSIVNVPANSEATIQRCLGASCDKAAIDLWLKTASCGCAGTEGEFFFDDEDIPVEDEDQYVFQSQKEIAGFVGDALRSLDWKTIVQKAVRNEFLYHLGSAEYDPDLFTTRSR